MPTPTIDRDRVAELLRDDNPPRQRLTVEGYTVRAGSPTRYRVRLHGEKRPRRVYVWQFSNVPTAFVRIGGVPHTIPDSVF